VKLISHGIKWGFFFFKSPFLFFFSTAMTQQSAAMSITKLCNMEELETNSNEQQHQIEGKK
jgi:hypothetical protein